MCFEVYKILGLNEIRKTVLYNVGFNNIAERKNREFM